MTSSDTLELLIRGAAVGAYLGVALIVGLGGRSPARVAGVLFSLAAAAHTLTQAPQIDAGFVWAWAPVWAFSAMGSGLFWAFATELFEDRPRLEPLRFLPAAALLAVAISGNLAQPSVGRGLWLTHNLVGASLMVHVLVVIAVGWRGDLVEPRRRLRGPILGAGALYVLSVTFVQSGELFLGSAEALSPIAAVVLVLLGLLSLVVFTKADPALFGPTTLARVEAGGTGGSPTLEPEEAAMAAKLDRLMREERLYRLETLSIAALALRLGLPEYRLRRLINQRLGHRNFAAFLNQWRIGEARAALLDVSQREVPISTIALDAGFQSLGPFNRAFRAETGLTPTAFRARAAGETLASTA
ncbi:MAG: helix-turn-helix domain-containing protein [Caulobacter sp.]|nr:helix-turn-helix domain-containing protein [Caulobacter sp.]